MTNQEAIKGLNNLFSEHELTLPCTESLEILHMSVAALERQIPKEPIEYEDKYYACPACGNPVMHKWEKYPTVLNDKKNGLPYCLGCGQALNWGENPKD